MDGLISHGHLGNKSPERGGFYRRVKEGKQTINLVLDPKTGAYNDQCENGVRSALACYYSSRPIVVLTPRTSTNTVVGAQLKPKPMMRSMACGRSDSCRRNFLGIHLFNPPHVIVGTEVIPPEIVRRLALPTRKRGASATLYRLETLAVTRSQARNPTPPDRRTCAKPEQVGTFRP
jgi:hypothetical protein